MLNLKKEILIKNEAQVQMRLTHNYALKFCKILLAETIINLVLEYSLSYSSSTRVTSTRVRKNSDSTALPEAVWCGATLAH